VPQPPQMPQSHIFISYARSTAGQARSVRDALLASGYEVWLDEELLAHRNYAEEIEERLRSAQAVVVIWSAEATKSEWVRSEANRARENHKLVQVSVDDTTLPMPFDQTQCVDLTDWHGDLDAPGWQKVLASLADLTGAAMPGKGSNAHTDPPVRSNSICVLPFVNMSDDPQQEYFSDGISEDIITDLSKVTALFVIARVSAFSFKGRNIDAVQIARQLKVSYVLEGSVRKAGGRVRITAQLIDGATGGHLWAERYDRDLSDIFAVQDEIGESIVGALRLKLLPGEERMVGDRSLQRPSQMRAYELVKLGGYFYRLLTPDGFRKAIEHFEAALAIDPNYSLAHSGLGTTYNYMALNDVEPVDRYFQKAEESARLALELDPNNASAHLLLAKKLRAHGRWDESNRHIVHATALAPGSEETISEQAYHHIYLGEIEPGIAKARRALQLNPLSPLNHYTLGLYSGFAGNFDEAIREMQRALDMGHTSRWLIDDLALVYFFAGKQDKAVELFATHYPPWVARSVRANYERAGYEGMLRGMLDDLIAASGKPCTESPWAAALFYAQLREADHMFQCLNAAADSKRILLIKAHRPFDPFRSDPRYRALLERIGLQP
jgi:TolB-like protein/Flp pilus assembly protein TadD